MTGQMTAPDVQGLARRTISALEEAERGGNDSAIRAAATQLDSAIAQISAEVDRDQAEESRLSGEHQRLAAGGRQHASRANDTATTLQLVSQERFVGETTLNQLTRVRTELQRQTRRRDAANRDPQAARFVEGNLTKAREALEEVHMPQPAAAVLLNLVATERVTPTVAHANYLFFASALRGRVPDESRDEVAARLAKIHFDSSVSNDAIATAFREYMALPRTEAGEAMRLTASFAQRLSAMASARSTEPNSLPSDDVDNVRRETGADFNWFMDSVGNDMAIATTLVSGVSSGLNRDRMLEIYRSFDADPNIDSMQAAVFAAALSGRAAEPGANLGDLRAETMRNYQSIMNSRPPEGMDPVDRFTAASYAAQGYGVGVAPAIVPGRINEGSPSGSHHPSFWDIYGPAIVMSQILNNDSRWDRRYGGYVSDYGAGYADGVRSARQANVPWTPSAGSTTWRSPSGMGLPSGSQSSQPTIIVPPRPIDVGTIARDAARAEREDGGALARARSTTMGTEGVRVVVPGAGIVSAAEARQRAQAAAAPRVAPGGNGPIIFGSGAASSREQARPDPRPPITFGGTRAPADAVRETPRAAPVQIQGSGRTAPVETREAPRAAPVQVQGSGRAAPVETREAPRAAPVAAPVREAPRSAPVAAPVRTAPAAAPVRSAPAAPARSAPSTSSRR